MFEKMKAKPDCTGQKFGMLVVLGKGSKRFQPRRNSYQQLWRLQCECGVVVELPRGNFDDSNNRTRRQKSCGCLKKSGYDNKRRPKDITGQKFGSLTAIKLTGKKVNRKPTWLLKCDCGNTRELSISNIKAILNSSSRLNCANQSSHPDRYFVYPLAPTPYPKEAGDLVIKYLHLTESPLRKKLDSEVEDDKRDRLLRAAWILTYRRWQGEEISELYEKHFIRKHLRYSSIRIFWQRKLESEGGLMYDRSGKKRERGSTMANITSDNYPVLETQGTNMLPTKRLKFKRH